MQASAFDGAARNFQQQQQQPGVLDQCIRSLEHESARRGDAAFLLPLWYSVELSLRQRTHMHGFFSSHKTRYGAGT